MEQWKQQIFDKDQYGETFLRFIITLIILGGSIVKAFYNSYGMAALPLFLIKGQRSLEDERNAVGKSIESVREQLRSIQEKYQRSHK
jgi:LMBR1 domain-containing protein 1